MTQSLCFHKVFPQLSSQKINGLSAPAKPLFKRRPPGHIQGLIQWKCGDLCLSFAIGTIISDQPHLVAGGWDRPGCLVISCA
jgi:hypothetical protein